MACMYLVTKRNGRGWGINPSHPHEIYATRKEANAAAKLLNEKATMYIYEVESVKVGEPQCK